MTWFPLSRAAALALPLALTSSCTIVSVNSQSSPAGVRADGLIDGHVAFGIRDEHKFLHVDLFDGPSDGAILDVRVWKIARLEIGLAGAAVGLGPVDLALGCLFFEPEIPRMMSDRRKAKKAKPHVHVQVIEEHDESEAPPESGE